MAKRVVREKRNRRKLKDFDKFLESVDLAFYRREYSTIKLVEMDLSRDVQAINPLYEVYWRRRDFLDYGEFYEEYLKMRKKAIEEFRKKIMMCKKCFYKGLPARIYRTWASIITQIHAGYVAESVFGEGTVSMSEELDRKGADFRVEYEGKALNYQVKKESFSREVRQEKQHAKKGLSGEFLTIFYKVPNFDTIRNPTKRNGEYKKSYSEFKREWLDTERIKVMKNGFVVFTSKIFEAKKEEIDDALE